MRKLTRLINATEKLLSLSGMMHGCPNWKQNPQPGEIICQCIVCSELRDTIMEARKAVKWAKDIK